METDKNKCPHHLYKKKIPKDGKYRYKNKAPKHLDENTGKGFHNLGIERVVFY